MTPLPAWLSDTSVGQGAVPPTLEGATAEGILWQAAPGRFLLEVPEVARYLVTGGQTIVFASQPGAQDAAVTRHLRLAPLAALLYQRGILALHAAAAVPPDGTAAAGAVLLAGDSAAGKSVLLVALLQRSWRMLADELTVLDSDEQGVWVMRPTFPEVKLWPDAAEALHWCEEATPLAATAPLRAIYRLQVHADDNVAVDEVPPLHRFRAVGAMTYHSHIAAALLDPQVYLQRAAAVANAVPMRTLRRPRRGWSAEQLADVVAGG